MKPNALLCTVETSMFARMAALRALTPPEAAARLHIERTLEVEPR
jgi:hypothetical protein